MTTRWTEMLERVTCTSSFVDVDFDHPTLVLEGNHWSYRHPGRVRVPIIAYEGAGNVWEGPRKGPEDATVSDAELALDRRIAEGIAMAFVGRETPTSAVGTLYVRQAWNIDKGPTGLRGISGRFGAVIKVPE